jgi:hypothetical protein
MCDVSFSSYLAFPLNLWFKFQPLKPLEGLREHVCTGETLTVDLRDDEGTNKPDNF